MLINSLNGQLDEADMMTTEQKLSFYSGYVSKLLPVGFELWRFVSKQTDNRFGAFWTDAPTMQLLMQTLHSNNNFTETYKKENIKNSLAILSSWSNLSWRVKVRLRKEVIAYVGETGTQKQFTEQENIMSFGGGDKIQKVTETRIGRNVQYVIPKFRGLQNQNEWADVELFVHI